MGCSPAFEGKSIRKEEMYVEFGGGRSPAFELLHMRSADEVTDGQVTVIGPEIDAMKEGGAYPLAIIINVAGNMMKKDYEPVLERRIHNFVNYGEGSWHVAQRDIIWVRLNISGSCWQASSAWIFPICSMRFLSRLSPMKRKCWQQKKMQRRYMKNGMHVSKACGMQM
jgi:CO dehydrogenase/acetyl-CoA synthase beta subunit